MCHFDRLPHTNIRTRNSHFVHIAASMDAFLDELMAAGRLAGIFEHRQSRVTVVFLCVSGTLQSRTECVDVAFVDRICQVQLHAKRMEISGSTRYLGIRQQQTNNYLRIRAADQQVFVHILFALC